MMARINPSGKNLLPSEKTALRSARVLKESRYNSGGAKIWGCPAKITLSKVEPERGGQRMKIAGLFF